jgi:hypothetical protein
MHSYRAEGYGRISLLLLFIHYLRSLGIHPSDDLCITSPSESTSTSVPTLEPDADRDVVITGIQGNNAFRSTGVPPDQTAVIFLAIGLVAFRRYLLSRSMMSSSSAASGLAIPLLPRVVMSYLLAWRCICSL